MTVTLYNVSSGSNVLNKSYTIVQENITATVKGRIDVDNPELLLDYTSMDFNYFYVSDFGRYYNVTSRSLESGQHIRVTGQSDPLESFASAIEGLEVLITRAEDPSLRSPELADNSIPLESDMQLDKIIGDSVIGAGNGMVVIGVI